jgi:hypothetical protein
VPVTAGRLTTAVDAALDATGGISGTVTAAAGGARLSGVNVEVFTSSGVEGESVFTGADGTYQVAGLPPSAAGYLVCFDTTYAAGGRSRPGYPSQCYRNVPWEQGSSSPAPGATPVPVTAGRLTTLNLALGDAGGISGTVTAAHGGARLNNVGVHVLTSSGDDAGYATTGADGTYQVTGLAPADYYVCFDASGATGGSSVAGYPSQCCRDAPWKLGSGLPPGATPVPVTAGKLTTAVNAALNDGGGISGTVTAAAGGAKLGNLDVWVFTSSGDEAGWTTTGTNGTYQVTGLIPASGYRVCFDASEAAGGSSPLGYASQCYRNVPWAGGSGPGPGRPAPGAAPVPVTNGRLTPAVNAALGAAGGISGTVTAAAGGTRLGGVNVEVYTSSGDFAGSSATGADGTYQVTGLTPAAPGYLVCFDASYAAGGNSRTGYRSQCFRSLPWNLGAPAAGATAVPVTAGRLTPAVNAALGG